MLVSTKYLSGMIHRVIVREVRHGSGEASIANRVPRAAEPRRAFVRARKSCVLARFAPGVSASRALIEVPSSAASTRISRRRAASSLSVMLVFICKHVQMCSTILRAYNWAGQVSDAVPAALVAGGTPASPRARRPRDSRQDAGAISVYFESFRAIEQYNSTASCNCFFSTYSPSVWAT